MATNNATLAVWTPCDAEVPFGGQVGIRPLRNSNNQLYSIPALSFQGQQVGKGSVSAAIFSGVLPQGTGGYTGTTGIKVQLVTNALTAGVVIWAASFELIGATDLPNPITENFPAYGNTNEVTQTATYTAAGLAIYTTIPVPIAKIQNGQTTAPAAGDMYRLRVRCATDNPSDTLADFSNLFMVSLQDY